MRLGIFGGSFDPPHIGHLLVAIDAVEALALDRLYLVPAATQPLKAGRVWATKAQRFEMVETLTHADTRLEADRVEIDREGLSYSVDTVADFARRFPSAQLFFLIGSDVVPTLSHWRTPERIAELARIVVLRRSGADRRGGEGGQWVRGGEFAAGAAAVAAGELDRDWGFTAATARRDDANVPALERAAAGLATIPGDAMLLATRRIDVSSTEVRERVRQGRTIRGFVPDTVAGYIEAKGLYR